MQDSKKKMEGKVEELEELFSGRLAGAIEVKYSSIHLELTGNLSSEDVDAIYRILDADAKVKRWRIQQVNNLLVLSVSTEDSELT